MRIYDPIKPFPANVDRLHFSSWLSGFIDGEGHFALRRRGKSRRDGTRCPAATFNVELREDDVDALELIRSYFNCGVLMRQTHKSGNPSIRLTIHRVRDLWDSVVPHFDKFPLLAKKREDYHIWRMGVELIHEVTCDERKRFKRNRWTRHYEIMYDLLHDELKSVRTFDGG